MAPSPMTDASGPVNLSILCAGEPSPTTISVVAVEIQRGYNRIPRARITFLDGDLAAQTFPVSEYPGFKPGTAIEIRAGYGANSSTIFAGLVVRLGVEISDSTKGSLILECRDKALSMTVARSSGTWSDKTDSDILREIVARHGLEAAVAETSIKLPELAQFDCTDWDFLLLRSEANGCLVDARSGRLSIQPPSVGGNPVLSLQYGRDILSFEGIVDATHQVTEIVSSSWDPSTQAMISQASPAVSLTSQGNLTASDLADVLGNRTIGLRDGAPLDADSLKARSKGSQMRSALDRIRGRVRYQGSALADVGSILRIDGVGARLTGDVLVTGVVHQIEEGNWTTEAEFGMSSDRFAERTLVSAPPEPGRNSGVSGLQIGVVEQIVGDPQGQMRIQVAIPVTSTESNLLWARMASSYATSGAGACFPPEVGDEVVLGFLNADPSSPVVLGSLFSAKHRPPISATQTNDIKAFVSRSKMRLEFDDCAKSLTLATPGGNTVVLSDEAKSIVLADRKGNKVALTDSGIVLDSDTDIAITARGRVTVSAGGNIAIAAVSDVSLTGTDIALVAQASASMKAAASAEISSSGSTSVKGALVMIN